MKITKRRLIQILIICTVVTMLALLWGCSYTGVWGSSQDDQLRSQLSNRDVHRFMDTVRIKTEDATYHYHLGRHFQQRNKHALAVKEFLQAVEIDPLNAQAFNAMGVSYDRMAKFDLAVQCYQWAVVLSPEFAAAYNNLGYSYLLQGKPQQALAPLRRATALQSENALFQNNLALAVRQTPPVRTADVAVEDESLPTGEDRRPAQPPAAAESPVPGEANRLAGSRSEADAQILPPADQPAEFALLALTPTPPGNNLAGIEADMEGQEPAWIAPRIVIANGNGAYRMGHNLGRFFEQNGFAIDRLTNADHFGYPRTMIYFSNGQRQVACQLARLLLGSDQGCDLIYQQRDDGYIEIVAGHNITELNDLFNGRLKIQVANGNGVSGAAQALSDQLSYKGFMVMRPVNADHFGYAHSRIVYPEGYLANARFVARAVSENWSGALVAGKKEQKTIRIILGDNFSL